MVEMALASFGTEVAIIRNRERCQYEATPLGRFNYSLIGTDVNGKADLDVRDFTIDFSRLFWETAQKIRRITNSTN